MELDKTEKLETVVKKGGFVNPFEVSYVDFQEALGKKTVAEYCKGKLTEEQIEFVEKELELLNKK